MAVPPESTSRRAPSQAGEQARGIDVDESSFPIVKLILRPQLTLEDIDAAYDRLEAIIRRGKPHVHWSDLRAVNPLRLSATLRKRFAERERQLYQLSDGVIRADVRVVDHPVVRNLLTAFEWLTGQAPWPVHNAASEDRALTWLAEQGFL